MSKQDPNDYSDLLDVELPFDLAKVRPECISCVRRQMDKFKNHVDENKKSLSRRFIVPCEGILKNPVDPRLKHVLSREEWEQASVVLDPVKWAAKYITHPDDSAWVARFYQEEVMRCTSKRRALRISRRTGKCISEQSQVLTEIGPISAGELFALENKPRLVSFNEDTFRTEFAEADVFDNGIKPVFSLRTKNGRETIVTGNHPFLARESLDSAKWVELEDLEIGDSIAVPSRYDHLSFAAKSIGARRSRLLGYLTGDGGTSHKTTVRFTNFDKEIVHDFKDIISDFGCELNEIAEGNYNVVIAGADYKGFKKNKVNKLVTDEGLRKLAVDKGVPKSILNGTIEDICNFLGAYWDCDGWASIGKNTYGGRMKPNVEVGVCSASKKLILQIKHLLLRLGIHSNLKEKKVKYKDGFKFAWQLTMAGKDSIEKFYNQIPLRAKQQKLQEVYDIVKDRKARICDFDFCWDPIISIEYIGEDQTYDISVPSNHTLVADDIISHNTDVVSVEICYHMFTKKGQRILVAAPQKVHVEEIIERVRGFLQRNPLLHNEVVRDVSSPFYEILLSNGSRVRGFALGTRGKSEGVAVRGQNADRIYCLPKGTPVHTSEFGLKPIEKLTLEDSVLGGDETGVHVGKIKNLGIRKDILVTVSTDLNTIKCTPDHPLFNGKEDIPAKDADSVICSLYYKDLTFGRNTIFARLLGYLYGDGWISGTSVGFSGGEKDLEQIQEDLVLLGIPKNTITTRITENKKLGIKGISSQFASSHAYDLFKDYHPNGRKVLQPLRVPDYIKNNTEYIKASFLSGLFSAEGEGIKYQVNNKTPKVIRLNMRSKYNEWITNWMIDLSEMLSSLDISHNIKIHELKEEDRFVGTISISNSKNNILNFINKIGYCYSADKTISANIYKLFISYKNRWNLESWKKNREINSLDGTMAKISQELNIPISTVKYHKKHYDPLYSEKLLTPIEYINKITWCKNYVILPIKKEGVRFSEEEVDVYNLTSDASNRFFAGGMFTHNCDEMDYADDKAIIGGLFPILQTTPDTAMTGFSTPTGFKSTYYSICEEVPSYREFFYNYKVLPHWKTVEKDRPQYTDDEWTHEMLAEWGTAESGVYKPSYVDRSLRSYRYEDMRPAAGWRYVMGVDWNEKHGAEIVVVGENISGGFYQVMHASVVEKSEFTQLVSVQALISAYKYWNPVAIYVDAGNGSTNYELIRKMSYDQRKPGGDPQIARLLDVVKRYDSGASIESTDPITNEKRKVPAKPYMVNAAVRAFEQDMMRISSADKVLEKQFRNYIVDRISPTGTPVYAMRDQKVQDHRLDAFNLAMVAFFREFGGLQQNNIVMHAFATVNPISKQMNSSGATNTREDPSERRLPDEVRSTILSNFAFLPAHVGNNTKSRISQSNTGKEYDMEAEYHQMYLQRQRRRARVNNQSNYIRRTNI